MLQSSRKIHNTVFIQTAMAPSTDTSQWHPAWHHVQTAKVCQNHPRLLHPAMAPSNGMLLASINGIQQWHPTTWHPAMAPYHGTQHPAMAPSIQQWHPPWHPAMAPYHDTQQWHHGQSVITTPRLLHPPMAPSNGTLPHGTQQWPACSNGTEQ